MFTGELADLRTGFQAQRTPFLVGMAMAVTMAGALTSARFVPFLLLLTVLAWIGARGREAGFAGALPELDTLTKSLAAFVGFCFLSVLWAVAPDQSLPKVLMAAIMVVACLVVARLAGGAPRAAILRPAEAMWIGLVAGLVFFIFECASDHAAKIWLFNAIGIDPETMKPQRSYTWKDGILVGISDEVMTRDAAPISLVMWPAVMAALGSVMRPWNTAVAALVVLLSAIAIYLSPHETSKLALAIGFVGLLLALVAPVATRWLVSAGWMTACLLVVPGALLAHDLDLHNSPRLQVSAQHRIIIWNFTAEQVLNAPIIGTGANMSYVLGPEITKTAVQDPSEKYERKMSRHAHNLYLQTWFELGAVGAVLLTIAGLSLIAAIARLDERIRPFGYATFVSFAAMAASSYGMWQAWFLAVFGLAAVCFAVGARALATRPGPP